MRPSRSLAVLLGLGSRPAPGARGWKPPRWLGASSGRRCQPPRPEGRRRFPPSGGRQRQRGGSRGCESIAAAPAAVGLERLGRLVVDSTKLRADASPEAVVQRDEFAALRAELEHILLEAAAVDAQEAETGAAGRTELGKTVAPDQMRDILRRVRRQRAKAKAAAPPEAAGPPDPPGPGAAGGGGAPVLSWADLPPAGVPPETPAPPALPMSPKMLARVAAGLKAIAAAAADGREHLCLTDPDARMMHGGRERRIQECHSFEVAVDQGLLVASGTTQENNDNARLEPLVAAGEKHEPAGVTAVTGDCGFYAGEAVAALLARGVEVCVPDANTACDLHRGQPVGTTRSRSQGSVPFTYEPEADVYHCPEGNVLRPTQRRHEA